MNAATMRMLLRPGAGSRSTVIIPATAFALVTALVLTVVGGAQTFWTWTDDYALLYQVLASVALALLIVPLSTLGGAAARLSARRRDERLSTLRLLGVTPGGVAAAAVIESTLIAALGVFVGIGLYFVLVPLVGLIPFRGSALGASAVILPPLMLIGISVATIALAAISAVVALRRVAISPLGVRTRQMAMPLSKHRATFTFVALVLAFVLAKLVPAIATPVTTAAILGGLFAGVLAVLSVVGPWVLKVTAQRKARRAKTVDRMLAARVITDDPKAAWRQVGGIAMASFMAVFAGTGVALMNLVESDFATPEDLALVSDMRTGLIITLVGSFLMVAASVGVTQASEVLDQRELHQSLHALGVPAETVMRARRRAVMSPLLITSLGSALCAALMVFPLLGITLIVAPLSLATIAAVVTAGIALVWLGTVATRPLIAREFAH
ncbi:FtsX-like permease family protein [Microbacterium sp. YY-01]|uniref:FtsX-like permease family protein n=1 Tax=Microbacterium sp. YY-01 TaxID=3421634 RepID=UPI003D18032E